MIESYHCPFFLPLATPRVLVVVVVGSGGRLPPENRNKRQGVGVVAKRPFLILVVTVFYWPLRYHPHPLPLFVSIPHPPPAAASRHHTQRQQAARAAGWPANSAELPPKEEKRWRPEIAGAGAERETMPHAASKKNATPTAPAQNSRPKRKSDGGRGEQGQGQEERRCRTRHQKKSPPRGWPHSIRSESGTPPKCGNSDDYLTIIVIAAYLGGVHAFRAMRVPLAPQRAAIPKGGFFLGGIRPPSLFLPLPLLPPATIAFISFPARSARVPWG